MSHIRKQARAKAEAWSVLACVIFLAVATSLSICPSLLAASGPSTTWKIEQLQPGAPGRFTSLKRDGSGNLHLVFVSNDGDHDPLIYAYWDHSLKRWFTMAVAQHAAFPWLVLDSHQRPHISYVDAGTAKNSTIHYANWDGAAWKKQALPVKAEVVSYYCSIALDTNDKPTLSFYEYEGPAGADYALRMRTVSWNGQYWEARTVDTQRGSGKFNSLANNSGREPHLAYANVQAETAGLRYAHFNGSRWVTELLEGGAGKPWPSYSVAIAVDQHDIPHIAYTDPVNLIVKYATQLGGKWRFEAVASIGGEYFPDRDGITVDEQGTPYITYYDSAMGALKLAWRQDGKWIGSVVDPNFAGATSSVQVQQGMVWIAYTDESGRGVKVAFGSLPGKAPLNSASGSAGSR
jgi:hypothetical protein